MNKGKINDNSAYITVKQENIVNIGYYRDFHQIKK
jgi:hypothetical protein